MSKNKIEVEIPFWGFYESIHDNNIDRAIESYYEDDQGNMSEENADAISMADVDWDSIRKEYCKRFVEELANRSELDFEYSDMTSPKYYNFETDRLFAWLPKEQADRVRKEVEAYPEWAETIKERFTDRSGFISNYDPDINHEDWTREELDQCQWLVILQLYFDHHLDEDWQIWCGDDVLANELDSVGEATEVIDDYIKEKRGQA